MNMSNTKNKFFSIVGWVSIFLAFVFAFPSFMNRMDLNRYSDEGISFSANISEISSYKKKMSKKSTATTSIMVKIDFVLKGRPGTTYLSEFISEEEAESLNEGQRVEVLYLPKSDFVSLNKINFNRSPIMKKTLENALVVNKTYFLVGGAFLILGIICFVIRRFLK